MKHSRNTGKFDVEVLDLGVIKLPMYDEPLHPIMQKYEHQHTKDWAAKVASADSYIIVFPEYNHAPPPSLLNAFDYVYKEWNYKPVGFVGYGGLSGGIRAQEHLIPIASTLKLVPLVESVNIPFFVQHINPEGVFTPAATTEESLTKMLDELFKWGTGLKHMRSL